MFIRYTNNNMVIRVTFYLENVTELNIFIQLLVIKYPYTWVYDCRRTHTPIVVRSFGRFASLYKITRGLRTVRRVIFKYYYYTRGGLGPHEITRTHTPPFFEFYHQVPAFVYWGRTSRVRRPATRNSGIFPVAIIQRTRETSN